MNLRANIEKNPRNEINEESRTHAIRDVFMEFCSSSTIHGVRYFTERRRHWSERLFWIFAFCLSVCFCSLSIRDIWQEWKENPITMSFTEKDLPISEIPFPTVTICPQTKTYREKLDLSAVCEDLEMGKAKLTNEKWSYLETLVHLCRFNLSSYGHFGQKITNNSIYDIIKEIAPTINDVMASCTWNYRVDYCTQYFKPILTEEGLCFTFNALNSHEIYTEDMAPEMMMVKENPNTSRWSLEKGYEIESTERGYPIRIFNVKQSVALAIFLQISGNDVEYSCRGLVPGFRVLLHMPGEAPTTTRHSFRIPLSEEALIAIKPTLITTSNNLRGYDPNLRQCFFNSDRKLKFFKIYTQSNCETECLANFTKKECGCVVFHMPRKRKTLICGAANVLCYQTAQKRLFGESVIDGTRNDSARLFRENCNCLQSCTSITYDAEIDRAKLNWVEALFSKKFQFHKLGKHQNQPSSVEIFFRDHQVSTIKRSEVNTYTNFIAICGGLLGLFLGISTLSIIEFIYYITLRLYWSIRQWKSTNVVVPFKRKIINSISIDIPN